MEVPVQKPWGFYVILHADQTCKIKRLHLNPGQMISLQSHAFRNEHWIVTAGQAEVTQGDRIRSLSLDDSVYINAGEKHRLANNSDTELVVIEVQTGPRLDEEDIVRFEDKYNRL